MSAGVEDPGAGDSERVPLGQIAFFAGGEGEPIPFELVG